MIIPQKHSTDRKMVTIQVCLEGKTILGKTIKAFSPLKVQALQKKAKTLMVLPLMVLP